MSPNLSARCLSILLGALIALGLARAERPKHWAFVAPTRPEIPEVERKVWVRNAIDSFVLARLEREGIALSAEAGRATLIRRVTLDLTGLPPSPAEVDAFLVDEKPGAYERVVDRLLTSRHHAERMAMDWLDLARYADTDGYEVDKERAMWPWRDWVIAAFAKNMPFDQFTIEQLAGDLLPKAANSQKVATGFNRNHRINRELGTIPEEWRTEYVVDRVDTTSTVWMGLTIGCARCHDHKYDPFSQREFYQLFAFFNNVPEVGNGGAVPNAPPLIHVLSPKDEAKLAELEKRLEAARSNREARDEVHVLERERTEFLKNFPTTMVMAEREKPRETFILNRGLYNEPGDKVTAAVPTALPPLPSGARVDRLALARWLVSGEHPLTARVAVNRFWKMFFGQGLVGTVDDFGSQGAKPTHPRLLDWLATEFMEGGWDMRAVQKLIVASATYRQSSLTSPRLRELDPDNRLLARASRLRLPAEMIRDQALFVSGLLVPRVGGPSVKPYQPPGVWDGVAYKLKYKQGTGEDLYRRSMYTFWKRTVPPPAMTLLDAPSRDLCHPHRSTTNTPLQSLLLMNETTYVEAARFLGQRMILEGGATPEARLTFGYRLVTAEVPPKGDLKILREALDRYRFTYAKDQEAAKELLSVGESPPKEGIDPVELASYVAIGSILLNFDRTITRE